MKCCHGNTTTCKNGVPSVELPGRGEVDRITRISPIHGITDFEHMKAISARVRELLGISEPLWSRSIADPPQDDMNMFLEVKSRTGESADSLTYTQFLNYRKK
ncbi:sterile alpha motif domain-containing protein 15 isoform X2 [Pangasianodon hypophthalmus]|uniref:sterile alpha motif domain-containing protein 15 isoform X2 n=1 Tax=Pangasianodon hypophthalmus TaxID=310915 RepID=UPI000EFE8663|nr:sterile alpha motif domain-containing protein 15 isoform X2 [Pangasianodon hypophthalmus]